MKAIPGVQGGFLHIFGDDGCQVIQGSGTVGVPLEGLVQR